MRRSKRPIVIAARPSPLSKAQAEAVGAALTGLHPEVPVEYRSVEAEGDRGASAPPDASAGMKGLFTRAVEQAVLDGKADLAVHSLKDLPACETGGLVVAAVPRRGDWRDCLVTADGVKQIKDLPPGALFGTSSARRAAQVLRLRPDLRVQNLRGNVQSRVRKVVEEKQCQATLMAVAGLQRAGLGQHAQQAVGPDEILPAPCQGALALQCRADDHITLQRCLPLNDAVSAVAVHAERQVVRALGGDCHSAIAALAQPLDIGGRAGYRLWVRVLNNNGAELVEVDEQAATPALGRLVKRVVEQLCQRGAVALAKASVAIG